MDSTNQERHRPWLGFALEEALSRSITDAADLVTYATPEVLVAQLPREVTVALLTGALGAEKLTPSSVLETAPPQLLAKHLDPNVLWRCLSTAASRAKLDTRGAVEEPARKWLEAILDRGLADGLISAADVVKFIPPAEFVKDAPLEVVAELIRSGLMGGKFDPGLVLTHLTPSVIAHKLPTALGWACIADGARRQLGVDGVSVSPPAAATASTSANGAAATPAGTPAATPAATIVQPQPPTDTKPVDVRAADKPKEAPREAQKPKPAAAAAPISSAPPPSGLPRRDQPPPRPKNGGSLTDAPIEPVLKKSSSGKTDPNIFSQSSDDSLGDVEVLDDQPLPPPPVLRQR